MQYTQEITLDLNANTAYTTIGAKQGDSGSRVVKVHLTQNGEDYIIEDGVSAYFRFRKPDGKAVVNAATIEDNAIYIVLTAQTLAAAGRGYADITLQSGITILSSVSFIVIIMASPQVANQATSGNEFGYLNAVVADANNIIYEAEAWARGTRGGVEVTDSNRFEPSFVSSVIRNIDVDSSIFMQQVGSNPGLSRIYTFTFTDNHNWQLKLRTVNGTTTSESDPELISSLLSYGIVVELFGGASEPNFGDQIQVLIEEPDNTFEQNAKYFAEQAGRENEKIKNLTVSAESSIDPAVEKDEKSDGSYDLHFYLPKGDTGDVNLMGFYIDLEVGSDNYGQVISVRPDSLFSADITSYTNKIILSFNKNQFLSTVGENFGTYIFNYYNNKWYLGNNIVELTNYGLSYIVKSGYSLSNGDSITIKFFEQVIFSIDNDGMLLVNINMEGS